MDKKKYSPQELEALWDIADRRSIPNLLPPYLGRLVSDAYKGNPELFLKNEDELLAHIPARCKPGTVDRRLRLSFWEEYNRVASLQDPDYHGVQKQIATENVIRGVCTRNWFVHSFMKCPEKVAFLVCPPPSYLKAMEEALIFGIDKIREYLELPEFRVVKGKQIPNMRVLELKTKIAFALAQQARGSIIKHQVETKNMHLIGVLGHKSLPNMGHVQDAVSELTMEELDKKIHQLELLAKRKASKTDSLPDIEVDSKIEKTEVMELPEDTDEEER